MTKEEIVVALAGNPNVGKSTLFNLLTGLRQYTANWPGKTVERKEGITEHLGYKIRVVDLPGTYSLTAYSLEEVLARRFIVEERPDVVIHIANATTLEKDLYLTIQLLELTDKVVLALNMIDVVEKKGIEIDEVRLSRKLGIPVVKISALKKIGIKELLNKVIMLAEGKIKTKPLRISYGPEIEEIISKLTSILGKYDLTGYTPRWVAIKLLEGDQEVLDIIRKLPEGEEILKSIMPARLPIQCPLIKKGVATKGLTCAMCNIQENIPICVQIATKRRILIKNLVRLCVKGLKTESISDVIDKYVLHKVLGPIILINIFASAFLLVFTAGDMLSDYASSYVDLLINIIDPYLSKNLPYIVYDLIVNGIFSAFSAVISFIPLIFMFFLVYSLMEDSGYLARAAVIMDRFMHALGLHGKAFLSIVMAFGCNVPGIMATRALESRRDRLIAILINPLVPCGARLGVMAFIISLFFSDLEATIIMLSLIALSLGLVAGIGLLLNRLFGGEKGRELIIELPEYRLPSIRNVLLLTWPRVRDFLKRAGTLIMLGSIIIWALYTFPAKNIEVSFGGQLGKLLEPLGRLMGLDWRAITSLIFGILAKEQVLAAMSIIYGPDLNSVLRNSWSPLQALTFLVVFMIYEPCIATIAVTKRETNSWLWTLFSLTYTIVLALLTGIIVFNIGKLFL